MSGDRAKQKNRLEDWLAGLGGAMTAAFKNIKKRRFDVAAEAFEDVERLYRERGESSHIAEAVAYRVWCHAKLDRRARSAALYMQALDLETQCQAGPDRLAQLRDQLAWARTKPAVPPSKT